MEPIRIHDMTKLFKKEILLYSFFDVRLKKPFRLMYGVYFVVVFLVVSLPLLILFWPPNPVLLGVAVGIPAFAANFMMKPIFNGRPFFSAMKVYLQYIINPKIYFDNKASAPLKDYRIDETVHISRRDDYLELFRLKYNK